MAKKIRVPRKAEALKVDADDSKATTEPTGVGVKIERDTGIIDNKTGKTYVNPPSAKAITKIKFSRRSSPAGSGGRMAKPNWD